ncbi:alpha/beta fold hydrolase [Croceicoccus bisphenolivorans]|uniref:alpha/beta fold hydrolase n=1 Tax=Croceicoccus bisphenolivorans TaxID=1783232 RepID=UPI000B019F05|nr:alpha/beta hydrolase [Croceicoccus bisphenolivorans]
MTMEQAAAAGGWRDGYWQSEDGLALHYRDYPGPDGSGAVPVVCIPGLTRNARDFHDLAQHLSMRRRVICVELRGRGDSEYARDPATYVPLQYVQDLQRLFAELGIQRAGFVGSSLGGLVTMLFAAFEPQRIAGAVLNDIGPAIEARGLARIAEYVGVQRSYPTWMHAARAMEETRGEVYPDWKLSEWIAEAKRAMELGSNGRITYDYDMRIGDAFDGTAVEVDVDAMWRCFDALAGKPVLVVRGELSDILSGRTAREMADRMPGVELVEVPRVGHLPMLDEAGVLEAIDRLFDERLSVPAKGD